jgi:hypothetical protein
VVNQNVDTSSSMHYATIKQSLGGTLARPERRLAITLFIGRSRIGLASPFGLIVMMGNMNKMWDSSVIATRVVKLLLLLLL